VTYTDVNVNMSGFVVDNQT